MSSPLFHITVLHKHGAGPMSKRISLGADGRLISDGSACVMTRGTAARAEVTLDGLVALLPRLPSCEALSLGALLRDLPDTVNLVTKDELQKLNGVAPPNIIARTAHFIYHRPDEPALLLLDYDQKAMTPEVKLRIDAAGGFLPALKSVLPQLADVGTVLRPSTSSSLYREDTGERLQGSGGLHGYIGIADGSDAVRALKILHDRCTIAGYGWMMLGKSGSFLSRSIVDRMVGAPERLVFEGAPVLDAPLRQDPRPAEVHPGGLLDTRTALPDLTLTEQARLKEINRAEMARLAPEAERVKSHFIEQQAEGIAKRTGSTTEAARYIVERQCRGVLLPSIVLPFDAAEFAGCTVGDVLADPQRFEGATLPDPVEGIEYGRGKAKIMLRADGAPWIHSFAHGRTIFEMKYDAGAIEAAIMAGAELAAPDIVVRMLGGAEVNKTDEDRLITLASTRGKVGKRAINQRLRDLRSAAAAAQANGARQRRQAARTDRRIQLAAPRPDAEWLPTMTALNDALSAAQDAEPPMRGLTGHITQVRMQHIPKMHTLTSRGANAENGPTTRIPAADLPLLARLSEPQIAELIEKYIEFTNDEGEPVHLSPGFVSHYRERDDRALPIVSALATLPIVAFNGRLLADNGLDRDSGIVFRIPPELLAVMPDPAAITEEKVYRAYDFLINTWLVDVNTRRIGKAVALSAALSIIQRSLLGDRPAYWVTAARRGGGKTTLLSMLLMAITGVRPAAAAWSPNEEERRKALLAYLLDGLPAIIWDNIPRGSQISCPHIEKSCTSEFLSDRKLGVSERVAASCASIHMFTGNNIGPMGDLSSRSLDIPLEVDRPDPENRDFVHADPIGWTRDNRGKILKALYTCLLANPAIRPGWNGKAATRFKDWWYTVGSAVENADRIYCDRVKSDAKIVATPPEPISFQKLFLTQEGEEPHSADLADGLAILATLKGGGAFTAADVAKAVNDSTGTTLSIENSASLRDLLYPGKTKLDHDVSPKSVGKRLALYVGEPVWHVDQSILTLRARLEHKVWQYQVVRKGHA
jgi:hypothetical protein